VSNFSVGDRVVVYPGIPCGSCEYCLAGEDSACINFGIFGVKTDGAYAELTVAKASNLLPIPNGVSFEEAAAFPVTYITAWHSLITRAGLRAGETVLIHGAGSGVGTAAIQIAKLAGAKVIATSGNKEKCAKAKNIGAEEALDYHYAKWPEKVRELTGGRGVEVVFDFIGPATFTGSIASLAKLGRLVSCGATTGADINFDLRNLYSRQISIIGAMLGSRAEFALLLRLLAEGKLKPVIDRIMPLAEAPEAHRLMEQAGQFGKIVLKP
jgi:NADPH:quinone reductase-like Zn-dependent oxidoreductase